MTASEPSHRVSREGDTVEVRLPESPTTGYRWHLDDSGLGVTVIDVSNEGPPPGVAGGAGTRLFRLHLADERDRELVFTLRRAWDPPERSVDRRVVPVRAR